MDTSKYLRSFIEIGLTEREAKVYMTLLSGKMFTILELQEAVNKKKKIEGSTFKTHLFE